MTRPSRCLAPEVARSRRANKFAAEGPVSFRRGFNRWRLWPRLSAFRRLCYTAPDSIPLSSL
jgi:hypothetical protein